MLEHLKAQHTVVVKIGGIMNRQSAGKSFAYILGTYLSDGCITHERKHLVFRLEVMDEDFAKQFEKSLKDYGVTHIKTYKIENPRYKQGFSFFVVSRDQDLIKILLTDTVNKTKVPSYVKNWSKAEKLEFISAIMDGEGYVGKRSKPLANGKNTYGIGIKMEHNLLLQIKPIMQSVGIQTGKFVMTKNIINVQTSTLNIRMWSWIKSGAKFYIQRKQNRIYEYIRNTNPNDYTLGTA